VRGSSGFLEKALAGLRIAFRVLGKELQRDLTAERYVLGTIHSTHPPFTEFGEDTIVRDGLADHMSGILPLSAYVRDAQNTKSTKTRRS